MGRAEDLFQRIEREGLPAIESLIAERASEELFLDFKRSADHGTGNRLHDHDRNNLRKAIGGFANAEGGLLVWGVECSRRAEDGDVAASKKPLTNPQRFVSWLEGAVSGCTVPPVIGVRSMSVPADATTGFVVTYIPQSSHAPHQLSGEGKYVIRAGSDFVPAPHGVVAGLFGRPPHPVILPQFRVRPVQFESNKVAANFTVVLANEGTIVAEDLFLSLKFPASNGQDIQIYKQSGWPYTSAIQSAHSWVCPREYRLAPGGLVDVATVSLRLNQSGGVQDFRCELTAGCKGAIPTSVEMYASGALIERERNQFLNSDDPIDHKRKVAQWMLGIKGTTLSD